MHIYLPTNLLNYEFTYLLVTIIYLLTMPVRQGVSTAKTGHDWRLARPQRPIRLNSVVEFENMFQNWETRLNCLKVCRVSRNHS